MSDYWTKIDASGLILDQKPPENWQFPPKAQFISILPISFPFSAEAPEFIKISVFWIVMPTVNFDTYINDWKWQCPEAIQKPS